MNKLYRKVSVNKQRIRPYAKENNFYKNNGKKGNPLYKKGIKQIIWCIIILLMVILIKNIDIPITNKATDVIKTSLEQEIDVKNSFKKISGYVREMDKIPDKVVNAFNSFTNKKNTNMKFIAPLQGEIISSYGENIDPILNTKTFQRGVDILAKENKEINSIAEGEIVEIGEGNSLGKYVKVKHSNDIFSLYGNCYAITAKKGQKIKQGEKIAEIHINSPQEDSYLHFELWVEGDVVDPMNYISFDKKML